MGPTPEASRGWRGRLKATRQARPSIGATRATRPSRAAVVVHGTAVKLGVPFASAFVTYRKTA